MLIFGLNTSAGSRLGVGTATIMVLCRSETAMSGAKIGLSKNMNELCALETILGTLGECKTPHPMFVDQK